MEVIGPRLDALCEERRLSRLYFPLRNRLCEYQMCTLLLFSYHVATRSVYIWWLFVRRELCGDTGCNRLFLHGQSLLYYLIKRCVCVCGFCFPFPFSLYWASSTAWPTNDFHRASRRAVCFAHVI